MLQLTEQKIGNIHMDFWSTLSELHNPIIQVQNT